MGFGGALGAALVGVTLGTYAGYKGGWLDKILMRISEIFMSFPQIILVLLLVSILGQSLWNLLIIFTITGWGSVYRMARSQMLSIREEEYVQALRAFGLNDAVICYKHMLPNALGPIMVNITLSTAMFILEETSLSFLGLGVPLNIPTWGNILNRPGFNDIAGSLVDLGSCGNCHFRFCTQRQLCGRWVARFCRSSAAGIGRWSW